MSTSHTQHSPLCICKHGDYYLLVTACCGYHCFLLLLKPRAYVVLTSNKCAFQYAFGSPSLCNSHCREHLRPTGTDGVFSERHGYYSLVCMIS
ncbi:hypothetical protein K474DRAFT_362209 [Panus rudis PR-1116 ss-1]|nr:hypothetical protein K474DRAFT_362209 [Panus rudis PR-1116 ss-1]